MYTTLRGALSSRGESKGRSSYPPQTSSGNRSAPATVERVSFSFSPHVFSQRSEDAEDVQVNNRKLIPSCRHQEMGRNFGNAENLGPIIILGC